MSEKLSERIDALCKALNDANDEFRSCLAALGIKTNSDCFRVIEDKGMRKQLLDAWQTDMESFTHLALARVDSRVQ